MTAGGALKVFEADVKSERMEAELGDRPSSFTNLGFLSGAFASVGISERMDAALGDRTDDPTTDERLDDMLDAGPLGLPLAVLLGGDL